MSVSSNYKTVNPAWLYNSLRDLLRTECDVFSEVTDKCTNTRKGWNGRNTSLYQDPNDELSVKITPLFVSRLIGSLRADTNFPWPPPSPPRLHTTGNLSISVRLALLAPRESAVQEGKTEPHEEQHIYSHSASSFSSLLKHSAGSQPLFLCIFSPLLFTFALSHGCQGKNLFVVHTPTSCYQLWVFASSNCLPFSLWTLPLCLTLFHCLLPDSFLYLPLETRLFFCDQPKNPTMGWITRVIDRQRQWGWNECSFFYLQMYMCTY